MRKLVKANPKPIASNGQKRCICERDVEDICKLTAKGLNESEACAMIGLNRETWFKWKSIHASGYKDIFTRIRGQRIDNLLQQLDKAATGKDGIRHDWRAADRLLAITAPDRFAARAIEAAPAPTVNVAIISDLAAKVYGPASLPQATKPLVAINDAPNGHQSVAASIVDVDVVADSGNDGKAQ